jgi:hypothetical protein
MSAERGWIGEPQPPKEWHTPGWVKTGGRHFVHCSRQADREALKEENPQSEHEAREPK